MDSEKREKNEVSSEETAELKEEMCVKDAETEEEKLAAKKEKRVVAIMGAICGILLAVFAIVLISMFSNGAIISDNFSEFDNTKWHYVRSTTGEEVFNAKIIDGWLRIPNDTMGYEPFIVSNNFEVESGKTIEINKTTKINNTGEALISYLVLAYIGEDGSRNDIFTVEYLSESSLKYINVYALKDGALNIAGRASYTFGNAFSETIKLNTKDGTVVYENGKTKLETQTKVPESSTFALYLFNETGSEGHDVLVDAIRIAAK